MSFYLRPANLDDAEIILEWRNDMQTRENSFSKDLIDLDTHLKWFERKLSDDNCFLYILMDDSERVGQVRIDRIGDVGEVSYMIAPDRRGRGYGKQIIKLIGEEAGSKVKVLVGLVESFNEASRKCFVADGYSEFVGGEMVCYIKIL